MIVRAIVEILKAVAIIIGLPLAFGFIVLGVVFWLLDRDVGGAFGSTMAGIAAGVFGLIVAVVIVLRRVADFDYGD
jgi:ABC-type spermidine/putrescine transport system permease subunit II